MALQKASSGEFSTTLTMRDEASTVVQKFANTTSKEMGGAASSFEKSGETVQKSTDQVKRATDELDKAVEKSKKSTKALAEEARESGFQLATVAKTIGYAAAAGAFLSVQMAVSGLKAADALGKQAAKLKLSAESFQLLSYQAGLSEVSMGQVTKSVGNMMQNISKAVADSDSQIAEAFRAIGLYSTELKGLSTEEQIGKIVDALGNLSSAEDRIRYGREIFGQGADSFMAAFEGGSKAIAATRAELEGLGGVLTNETVKNADEFFDNLGKVSKALGGIRTAVTNTLASDLKELSGALVFLVKDAAALKAFTVVLELLGKGLLFVVKVVATAVVSITSVVGDIGRIAGGIMAALALLSQGKFREAGAAIGATLDDLKSKGLETKEVLKGLWGLVEENETKEAGKPRTGRQQPNYLRKQSFGGSEMGFGLMKTAFGSGASPGTFSDFSEYGDEGVERLSSAIDKRTQTAMNSARSLVHLGLHNVEEMLKSDEERRINEVYRKRFEALENGEALGLETETSYAQMRVQLEDRKQQEIARIQRDAKAKQYGVSQTYDKLSLQSSAYFFGQMGALMQTNSRKLFEIGKAGAIAETIIQTYRAAQGAYAAMASIPFVGPALGVAAAAAAVAVGFARVQAINSTQYGSASGSPVLSSGGFSGPVVSGDSAVVPISPAPIPQASQSPRQTVNVYLSGEGSPTQNWLRDVFVPGLNEVLGDGVVLNIRGGDESYRKA